jgi:futalosine hydrolase
VVTAVDAERDALAAGFAPGIEGVERLTTGQLDGGYAIRFGTVGVGPAAAAAGTARLLALAEAAGSPYRGVISAGIGGGFTGRVEVGGVALASVSIAADLGADSPDGFLPLDELGFGTARQPADAGLLAELAEALPSARRGPVLTVSTVTGTGAGLAALVARYPDAVAEGMEGFGVATAAAQAGVPFAELRSISNPVGPRDRAAWRIGEAMAMLTKVGRAIRESGLGKLER